MHIDEVHDHIERGNTTAQAIADAADLDRRHVGRELKEMCEAPGSPLARERSGQAFEYYVPERASTTTTAPGESSSRMPVNRNYNWDQYVPTAAAEYIPSNGEWAELQAEIDARHVTGEDVRALIGGPTGCGKTTIAEAIAYERGWPLFTIQMKYSMTEADLLGSPAVDDETSFWVDGTLTKAFLASQDTPVVLLLDEANRARPEAKSALFNALDHRGEVVLEGARGGEVISGEPRDIIVIATINEGDEYFVEQMDPAEKRRYGRKWNVDYLGYANDEAQREEREEREADLVADRTTVGIDLALELVDNANEIRAKARDRNSDVGMGTPTSAVLDWARSAQAYSESGLSNPVVRAGKAAVVRPFYDDDDGARDTVQSIITSNLDGCPVADDDVRAWLTDDYESDTDISEDWLKCPDCGWRERMADAPDDARDWYECPECAGALKAE